MFLLFPNFTWPRCCIFLRSWNRAELLSTRRGVDRWVGNIVRGKRASQRRRFRFCVAAGLAAGSTFDGGVVSGQLVPGPLALAFAIQDFGSFLWTLFTCVRSLVLREPMEAAKTMITNAKYQDTPSIVHNDITTVRTGRTLKYADLSGREKRDYLFDQGIRATDYANYKDETRPEVVSGLVQFSKSALQSITETSAK